jgi:hypothetical protein
MWVKLYDLPQEMMKEIVARQLGGQLGNFIKVDTKFLGYMRVRVVYPLHKASVPELKVKIREGELCRSWHGMKISLTFALHVEG